jgi:hypothetical protein
MKYSSLVLVFILAGFLSISALPMISASLGTFEQNTDVQLVQTCNNCTYCNLTSIRRTSPTALTLLNNVVMTQNGAEFNYNLSRGNISTIGAYKYCYDCGNPEDRITGCIDFNVTPSGEKNILGFFIIIILAAYGVGFIGFFGKNEWVSMIGGFAMMALLYHTLWNRCL